MYSLADSLVFVAEVGGGACFRGHEKGVKLGVNVRRNFFVVVYGLANRCVGLFAHSQEQKATLIARALPLRRRGGPLWNWKAAICVAPLYAVNNQRNSHKDAKFAQQSLCGRYVLRERRSVLSKKLIVQGVRGDAAFAQREYLPPPKRERYITPSYSPLRNRKSCRIRAQSI